MASFSAQVSDWVRQTKGASKAVLKQSAQELVNEAQTPRALGGRMRVDTGFLRASLMASTASMPKINPSAKPAEGGTFAWTEAEIAVVLAGADLGDTIYFGWTAAYAAHREFGARGQPPDAFVRSAAQKWPQIVQRVEAQLSSRLGR